MLVYQRVMVINGDITLHNPGDCLIIWHIFVWGSCFWFCIPPPPASRPPAQLVHTQLVLTQLVHTELVIRQLVPTQLVHTPLLITQLVHT